MAKTKIRIQKVPLEELMKILPPEVLKAASQSSKLKKKMRPTAKSSQARSRS